MYTNVLEILENSAAKYPERLAFGDTERDITFRDLVISAQVVGTMLTEKINIADPVAFYMDKSVNAVCGMLGVVYAGGFYSFLDVKQPQAYKQFGNAVNVECAKLFGSHMFNV